MIKKQVTEVIDQAASDIKSAFQGKKDGVIESNYTQPSKVMTIQPGVQLIEKGKVTKFEGEHQNS